MDRFNIIAAYYLIASLYHSGQSSKGYAILSRITLMGFQPSLNLTTDPDVRWHAAQLLRKRRREIRHSW